MIRPDSLKTGQEQDLFKVTKPLRYEGQPLGVSPGLPKQVSPKRLSWQDSSAQLALCQVLFPFTEYELCEPVSPFTGKRETMYYMYCGKGQRICGLVPEPVFHIDAKQQHRARATAG